MKLLFDLRLLVARPDGRLRWIARFTFAAEEVVAESC